MLKLDNTTLHMALIGYQAERQKIQAKIAELQRQLGGRNTTTSSEPSPAKRARPPLSAAAKKRMAAAQKKALGGVAEG